jgi:hypothetical protein
MDESWGMDGRSCLIESRRMNEAATVQRGLRATGGCFGPSGHATGSLAPGPRPITAGRLLDRVLHTGCSPNWLPGL